MEEERKYTLVYFNLRGLAEPIRWMFKAKNVPFEDERIDLSQWPEERDRFEKYMGNLPILKIDGKVALTQVHAVMRYVASQLGFNGQTEMEKIRADEVSELIYELRLCAVALKECYTTSNPDIVRHTIFRDFRNEKCMSKKVLMRKRLQNIAPMFLDKFASYLEDSDGQYLAGPNLTYADFALVNFLGVWEDLINPDILSGYPTLKALREEILEIPEIADYIEKTTGVNDTD